MIDVEIAGIEIRARHRTDMGDIKALAASIRELGLLQPIAIDGAGRLIAGERRLQAVKLLGWQTVPAHMVTTLDDALRVLKAERDENTQRKDFTPSEVVALAADLELLERPAAKERQREHGGTAPGRGKQRECPNCEQTAVWPPASEPPDDRDFEQCPFCSYTALGTLEGSSLKCSRAPESLDKVAAALGMSRKTLVKAKEVVAAAEAKPERFAPLVAEMDRTGRVNGVYRKLQVQQQAEKINQEPAPLPTGPFRVIVADPPWPYEKRAEDASHRASLPYPSMTLDDIRAMPVEARAADDAILWLWTTNAHMPDAFSVVRAWGFEHKTILTWVKSQMGTGDWLRGMSEHCIMAVRGKPAVTLTNQTTVLHGPLREHSRKPDEFYALVESLCPGSKLEMFAREQREGWHLWGSETGRFDAQG